MIKYSRHLPKAINQLENVGFKVRMAILSLEDDITRMIWPSYNSQPRNISEEHRTSQFRRRRLSWNQSLLPRLVFILTISGLLQCSFRSSPKTSWHSTILLIYMFFTESVKYIKRWNNLASSNPTPIGLCTMQTEFCLLCNATTYLSIRRFIH